MTDENEAPVITSDGAGANANINAAENQTAVTTVEFDEQDAGDVVTYSLTGADSTKFDISVTGELTFKVAPDYEANGSAGGDNDYLVTVTVTDLIGETDSQNITVSVTDVNEAPVITSDGGGATASVGVVENTTAVTTVEYTDEDAADTILYILSGVDSTKFNITAGGVLTFVSAPDFEIPTSNGGGNDYLVTVTVSYQNGGFAIQDITVSVTDENETPVITRRRRCQCKYQCGRKPDSCHHG